MCIHEFFKRKLQVLDEGILRQAEAVSKRVTLKKGERLIEAGERHETISFLVDGVLRGFLVDVNGRDITDCFVFQPGQAAVGCHGIEDISPVNIEAMTDCELVQIPTTLVKTLMEAYPDLMQIYNNYLIQALERHWELKMTVYRYTAMERYQWFLNTYPGLIDTVSNKHIASFLAMTPVTLSRLRRQLREESPKAAEANELAGTAEEPDDKTES